MALLGALLTSLIAAAGNMRRQALQADRRIEACRIADALLSRWWDGETPFPRNASGIVEAHEGWRWRTRVVPNRDAWRVYGEVVALELFCEAPAGREPAARVEVLLPTPTEDETDDGQ